MTVLRPAIALERPEKSGKRRTCNLGKVMESKDQDFLETLQEFSTSLALADPEDPASFRSVLEILDRLSAHPWAKEDPHAVRVLASIQERVEESIVSSGDFQCQLAKIEEDLARIHCFCVGREGGVHGDRAPLMHDGKGCSVSSDAGVPEPWIQAETDRELYEDFLLEASESLGSIEMKILGLERDPENRTAVNEIFRPFHTIKGVSGFLNLAEINKVAHAVEDLLDQARQGAICLKEPEVEIVLEAVDLLRLLLGRLEARLLGEPCEDPSGAVNGFLGRIQQWREPREGHPECIAAGASSVDKRPGAERPESSHSPAASHPERLEGEVIQTAPQIAKREEIDSRAGGLLSPGEEPDASREAKLALEREDRSSTVKVDMQKLDCLVNIVGELVIAQSLVQRSCRIPSFKDHALTRNLDQLGRITSELQSVTMSLRMVPLQQTFRKMTRLVRDLVRKSGKSVELLISGEDTEIDRRMVDSIYEPLVHMVRNAVDHGIESPGERIKAGKAENGTIRLKAYQKGGTVHIEIRDDGRGLDLPGILAKARERGLVGAEEGLDEHEVAQLIFCPGVTTAQVVTNVSGRGVGMDVVRKAIEALRGRTEILSQPGQGCTFVLKVPITLSIIDGMIVRVGKERFILPSVHVKEAIRPRREDCFTIQGKGEMIRIRDSLFPLLRLHEVLRIPTDKVNPWEALVIVVENEGSDGCFLVDEVLETQDVVMKNLGKGWKQPDGIAGGSILGDGRVGLILDIGGIIHLHQGACPRLNSARAA